MKKKTYPKKFAALVLGLVIMSGLAMPAMTNQVYAATNEDFTPVWVVPPPLDLTSFWLCVCGEFIDSQGRVIDSTTGHVADRLHYGHGGGLPGWVFDPVLNLFGHPGYSDEYHYFMGMHPVNEFENVLAFLGGLGTFYGQSSGGLIVAWEVDSTMMQRREWWAEDDWTADWWYLPHEAFSGRAALMYNRQLVTGFEFNSIVGLERFDFDDPVFGFFAAQIGDRWGLIDRHGDVAIPYVFSNLILIDENTAFANFNGSYGILDLNQTMANVASTPHIPHNLSSASPWAHEGITTAIGLDIVPENLQNHYTDNITRAEFAALAVALYETVTSTEITGRMQFNDTSDVNVQKVGYLGVVTGLGDGSFAPNSGLTREQAAVMLSRLANVIGQPFSSSAPTFADNTQISSWAIDSVGQMQATGVMGGAGNNMFAPQGDYTREQSIITILRLFDILN